MILHALFEILKNVDDISFILIDFECFSYNVDDFCWILVISRTERVKIAKRAKVIKRVKLLKLNLDFKYIYIYIILVFHISLMNFARFW